MALSAYQMLASGETRTGTGHVLNWWAFHDSEEVGGLASVNVAVSVQAAKGALSFHRLPESEARKAWE